MKSIEKKAKAYDEALEIAKKELQCCGTLDCDAAKQIYRLFPELKESEDKRIRKEIIEYLSTVDDKELIPYESWIAWLEKQGEQKPAWSEDDEKMIRVLISMCDVWATSNQFYPKENKEMEAVKTWFKSLKERYTWKPSDEQMKALDLAIRCGINRGTTEETTLVSLFNDLKKLIKL